MLQLPGAAALQGVPSAARSSQTSSSQEAQRRQQPAAELANV
ncbi:hypothetical protein [Pseudarthrobacter sp. S3]